MRFIDWFGLAIKKNKEFSLTKIEEQSVDLGMMAAGDPSAEAGTLSRMMDQKKCSSKMLMVQDGEYCPQVTEYALKMARRLDCAIIALDISDKPLQFSGDRKIRESDLFIEKARKNGEQFVAQAETRGIRATHVMDIGETNEIIARICKHDAGIRYLLNQPVPATARLEQNLYQVPVVALHCLQP